MPERGRLDRRSHAHQPDQPVHRCDGHTFWSVETAAHCRLAVPGADRRGGRVRRHRRAAVDDRRSRRTRWPATRSSPRPIRCCGSPAVQRELAANDPQHDFATALGPLEARNVELDGAAPFPFSGPVAVPAPPVTQPRPSGRPAGHRRVTRGRGRRRAGARRRRRVCGYAGRADAAQLGVGDEVGV